ncbi:MAG: alpha/beta hydrolase, partial [Muribaculaceae bacterium]|nr:alpha/beta hydrolase [Muribaculaceae bacterium]
VLILKVNPDKEAVVSKKSILIFPGGAYENVCWESEGLYWAKYFTEFGLNTYIVDYHLPAGNPEIPLKDGITALKYVRELSPEAKVGIVGMSAGGNLAALLSTQSPIEIRPDFQILFYPVISLAWAYTHYTTRISLIGDTEDDEIVRRYSPEYSIDENTPNTFISVCKDDDIVNPVNSNLYHMALLNHGVQSILKVYDKGGHGWNDKSPLMNLLKTDLAEWLTHEFESDNNQESNIIPLTVHEGI